MTPSEFKAWFDGFTEAFSGCPTKAQWTRIKERVSEIDGKAVTERVYVDRYWPLHPGVYYNRPYYSGVGYRSAYGANVSMQNMQHASVQGIAASNAHAGALSAVGGATHSSGYNSLSAMNSLGRAEAKAFEN